MRARKIGRVTEVLCAWARPIGIGRAICLLSYTHLCQKSFIGGKRREEGNSFMIMVKIPN